MPQGQLVALKSSWRSGVSAERRKPCREFRWRLSPEGRYAETDGSRAPQFAIRNSKWSGLLFRCSFWVGRLGQLAFGILARDIF